MADTDTGTGRMEKINVRLPEPLLNQVDEATEQRGYTSTSEAVRDALRDWVETPQSASDLFGGLNRSVDRDGVSTDDQRD